jgi:tetratricopeptide (TPR) repeat protein
MADYNVSRSIETLEEAISVNEEALLYCLTEREGRAELLEDLGIRLHNLCRQHSCRDIRASRCIEVLREASNMRPVGHALRAHSLHRLAKSLFFVSYDYLGNRQALDEAIVLTRESLHLFSCVHPERDDALNTLACALRRDFEYSGDLDVLAECIESHREALLLRPPGHPLRDRTLNNLSTALLCSFEHQGGFDVLAEAISLCRQALQLRPVGHPLRWSALENLGISLYVRVNVVDHGQTEMLAEAVCHQREAVELLPSTHPKRGEALVCLANSLVATFRVEGSLHSLAEAITLYRSAVGLYPPDHPDHDELLAKFAEALKFNFDAHGDAAALSEAVTLHQEALKARPSGHPQRLESLVSLADLHLMTEVRSWSDARRLYDEALEICPAGYPVRARLLSGMSRCFLDRDSPFFRPAIGIRHLTAGYADQFSHINQRLRSAVSDLRRVEDAYNSTLRAFDELKQEEHSEEVLHLYVQVIGLLPRAANFGLDSDARLRAVSGSDEIARNAAGRALALERVSQAVEMLEQGRGVFWSQSLHLRATGFDDLPSDDRRELLRLLRLLEQGARRLESAEQTTEQRERDLECRRQLNGEAEALISRIRGYPGLERFLLPPAFDALVAALPHGYVVIVNVSRLGHHALLLRRDISFAVSLELKPPRIAFDSATLRAQLPRDASAETNRDAGTDGMRAMRLVRNRTQHVEDTLALLWTSIVQPIISKLALQVNVILDVVMLI